MISSQVSFLLRYGLYQFGETVFKNGRISPYTVRLQQYPPNELFQFLAQLAWNLEQLASLQAIHCFGIANSGIRLATAIYEHGLRLGKHAELSILYPLATEQHLSPADGNQEATATALIDNAVTTGETLAKVLGGVRQFGYRPEVTIRIFDREDVGEDGQSTVERIKTRFDLDLISIFKLRDIVLGLDPMERQAILAYQSEHGTTSFKDWIGGQSVI